MEPWLETTLLIVKIAVFIGFIALIYPYAKKENWKEKFIDNKRARTILIIFISIMLIMVGISTTVDFLFPVETTY